VRVLVELGGWGVYVCKVRRQIYTIFTCLHTPTHTHIQPTMIDTISCTAHPQPDLCRSKTVKECCGVRYWWMIKWIKWFMYISVNYVVTIIYRRWYIGKKNIRYYYVQKCRTSKDRNASGMVNHRSTIYRCTAYWCHRSTSNRWALEKPTGMTGFVGYLGAFLLREASRTNTLTITVSSSCAHRPHRESGCCIFDESNGEGSEKMKNLQWSRVH
jgi:hypothetical protein